MEIFYGWVGMSGGMFWMGGCRWGVVTRFSITHNYNSNEHISIKIINSEKTETIWDEYR